MIQFLYQQLTKKYYYLIFIFLFIIITILHIIFYEDQLHLHLFFTNIIIISLQIAEQTTIFTYIFPHHHLPPATPEDERFDDTFLLILKKNPKLILYGPINMFHQANRKKKVSF